VKSRVYWVNEDGEWRLYVSNRRYVATVWPNGTWHTWDRDKCGAENSVESTVKQAKVEAAASAIAQGFI
jgi:hypothetical protein